MLYGGAERGSIGAFGTLRFVWRMGIVLPIFLMMRSRSLLGINMLRLADHKPELLAECLRQVVVAHQEGVLHPKVHATHAHTVFPQAMADLESGRTMGKVVVSW